MKKQLLTPIFCMVCTLFATYTLFAQPYPAPPEGIVYQAEARSTDGKLLTNKTLEVKLQILPALNPMMGLWDDDISNLGFPIWEGIYTVNTDKYGLFSLVIGEQNTNDFQAIEWDKNKFFLKVLVEEKGQWIDNGTTQFLAVPYAMHAKTVNSVSYLQIPDLQTYLSQFIITNGLLTYESDPIFSSSAALGITSGDILNWSNAFGWGDHTLPGYLTDETDPVFTVHPVSQVTNEQIQNWDLAFGWGDHTLAGYLTSETETDPQFGASPAFSVTLDNIANWNTAFGWGDHTLSGYLTDETDPVFTVHPVSQVTNEQIQNWDLAFGWGDHTLAGYLTSEKETDPIFDASPAATITAENLAQWIAAYGWGDHAEAGYLTEETDPDPTNEIQNLSQVLTEGNDAGARRISNLADPIDDQDAVTKAYINQLESRIETLESIIAEWNPNVDNDDDGYTLSEGDCDDTDPDIHPGAQENCDGIDNDCDGTIDEGCVTPTSTCFPAQDNPINTMIFLLNQERILNDLDPVAPDPRLMSAAQGHSEYMASIELLTHTGEEGSDFWDRVTNEGYMDPSGEAVAFGVGDQGSAESILSAWMGSPAHRDLILQQGTYASYDHMHIGVGVTDNYWTVEFGASDEPPYCESDPDADVDQDGYSVAEGDCDDSNANVHPGAVEICDGEDNDCDGSIDEDCVALDCHAAILDMFECAGLNCQNQFDLACLNSQCSPEMDMALTCLDLSCVVGIASDPESYLFDESLSNETKAELLLENCGLIDADGDGFNNFTGDCDDADENVYPGADEICDDGIDQDCNGVDAICGDDDGDGFLPPEDCDNTNQEINPGAGESCNGLDDNCDGIIDNVTNEEEYTWYEDGDEDGAGNPEVFEVTCNPPPGWVQNDYDCDDEDAQVSMMQIEVCDGIDNNCDGFIDEGCPVSCSGQEDCEDGFYCESNAGMCVAQKSNGEECLEGFECIGGLCIDGYCYDDTDTDNDGLIDILDPDPHDPDTDNDGLQDGEEDANANGVVDAGETDPNDWDTDNDNSNDLNDCEPLDNVIYPGAPELCDGIDNDCNGYIDDGSAEYCDFPNAAGICQSGNCVMDNCLNGFVDVDGDDTNGCEVDLSEYSNSCINPEDVGNHCADEFCGFLCNESSWVTHQIATGIGSRWFSFTLDECSTCLADLVGRLTLYVPEGVDYDLYVYDQCNVQPLGSSMNPGSSPEQYEVVWEEGTLGTDHYEILVEVQYYSGSSSNMWTLYFDGRNCSE